MRGFSVWVMAATAAGGLLWHGGCCRHVRRYPVPSVTDLVGALRRTNRSPRSVRAKVTADQRSKRGRIKATVYLLADRSGGLRMEATVLDNTMAVLASDGQKFYSIDFRKKIVYLGPALPCNIARLFGIPLRPGQVGLVLMGGMPVLRHDGAKISWDRCRGTEVLELRNSKSGLTQRVFLKKTKYGWRVEGSVVRDSKGKKLVSIRFKKFVRRAGSWMPTWIRYLQPPVGTDVLLLYRKVEADVDIPQDAYRIEPPAGYPVRWLSCQQRETVPFESAAPPHAVGPRASKPQPPARAVGPQSASTPRPVPATDPDKGRGNQNASPAEPKQAVPGPVAPARKVKP